MQIPTVEEFRAMTEAEEAAVIERAGLEATDAEIDAISENLARAGIEDLRERVRANGGDPDDEDQVRRQCAKDIIQRLKDSGRLIDLGDGRVIERERLN